MCGRGASKCYLLPTTMVNSEYSLNVSYSYRTVKCSVRIQYRPFTLEISCLYPYFYLCRYLHFAHLCNIWVPNKCRSLPVLQSLEVWASPLKSDCEKDYFLAQLICCLFVLSPNCSLEQNKSLYIPLSLWLKYIWVLFPSWASSKEGFRSLLHFWKPIVNSGVGHV